jgi:hypothetical protein
LLEDRLVPAPATLTVDPGAADGGVGSLRWAISQANASGSNMEIDLPASHVYRLTLAGAGEDNNATGDLDVTKAAGVLTIAGQGAGVVIDASTLGDRALHVLGASVVLRDLTISGGHAADAGNVAGQVGNALGGGILNNGGHVTLIDVSLTSNTAAGRPGGAGTAHQGASAGAAAMGGGIYSTGGSLDLEGSTLAGNQATGGIGGAGARAGGGVIGTHAAAGGSGASGGAALGGGVFVAGSALTIATTTLSGNRALGGAGGAGGTGGGNPGGSNAAGSGGLGGNGGAAQGAGLYVSGGAVTISTSTLALNQGSGGVGGGGGAGGAGFGGAGGAGGTGGAAQGGGLYITGPAAVSVVNSTVSDSALAPGQGGSGGTGGSQGSGGPGGMGGAAAGGGLFEDTANVTLLNGTVAFNTAGVSQGGGGGMGTGRPNGSPGAGQPGQGGGARISSGTFGAQNTIFARNSAASDPDFFGALASAHNNLLGDGSGSNLAPADPDSNGNLVGTSAAPIDPLLGPLTNNGGPTQTRAIPANSPAIYAGLATAAPTTDQRGVIRGNPPDIGAFEFPKARVTSITSTQPDGTYTIGAVIPILLAFSQTVTVTGTPRLALNSGGTANYSSGGGTATLTFIYTVAAGQSSSDLDGSSTTALTLNGGTIRASNGLKATLTLPAPGGPGSLGANKNIVIDTMTPARATGVNSSTANGSYTVGSVITITVSFNGTVNVTGTPQLALNSGGTATFSGGSGSPTLTFTYAVAAGQNSNDLDYTSTTALSSNGGTIIDAGGHAATLTLPAPGAPGSLGANKSIVIDTTPPTVTVNQAAGQPDPTSTAPVLFSVVFSEPVAGFTGAGVVLGGTAGATHAAVSGSGTTYTIAVTGMTHTGTVTASLAAGAASDAAGNPSIASTSSDNTVRCNVLKLVATGPDGPGGPEVKVFDAVSGAKLDDFLAYDPHFTGGVRVAVADVTGDGMPDIITAPGPGGGPDIRVFNVSSGTPTLVEEFMAYDPRFTGGVFVAAGDLTGDGRAEIVTGPDQGGGPDMRIFNGGNATGQPNREFLAYDLRFTGGVRLALGDVTGDGIPDVLTAPGVGGGPDIRVFDGQTLAKVDEFMAYSPSFTGGVYIAAGDVNGDGTADLITGAGPGGGPHVKAFDGTTLGSPAPTLLDSFYAYGALFTGGVRVAAVDVDGDGKDDIVTTPGSGGGPHVRVFDGTTGQPLTAPQDSFFAYDPAFAGGVFVGAR